MPKGIFADRMNDPEYRCNYEEARRRTDQFDSIVRLIEMRRNEMGWSYEELACQADMESEDIRWIYSLETPDPPLSAVVNLACAVGLDLGASLAADTDLGTAKLS